MALNTPVLLLILDGIGCREDSEANAFALAKKPNWDKLWSSFPHTTLDASEKAVGLPALQMGNSEVGHLNIGAGRIVYQELSRIDLAIENREFFSNFAFLDAIDKALKNGKALHILGLLSPGGVHSHESHIHAMLEMAAKAGIQKIYLHVFLDGRDTPPKSAEASLLQLQAKCDALKAGKIASVCGRFYAMDRDKRWDRVKAGYDLISAGKAEFQAKSAVDALQMAYGREESDEFVKPTSVEKIRMEDGDVAIFMNFRADRAREITKALTDPAFKEFDREYFPKLASFVMLTHYGDEFPLPVAFPPVKIDNCFGEYISAKGLRQLRIAETEKYAHVTYFFNGGREEPYPNEERILVPSPKVSTYDLMPQMSAREVTEKLVEAIKSRKFDAIVCNYANGDMVGHTGNLKAAIEAVETLDECIGRAVEAMRNSGGEVLITADHGNAEMMLDRRTHQAHTAHTLNRVPFLYVGKKARLLDNGTLRDVAPSMLAILGLQKPAQMTGQSLIIAE